MMRQYYRDGEVHPDAAVAIPDDPTLNNVGSVGKIAAIMHEHGAQALALMAYPLTGVREQAFVAVGLIAADTIKEVCGAWLQAKYGILDIKWSQTKYEFERSDDIIKLFHATFTARASVIQAD